MSIVPESDALKKAVAWVGQERKKNPNQNLASLVDKACRQFDLSPKDASFLFRLVTEKK